MPRITFIEANGQQSVVDIAPGDTLMQGAVDNSIVGIVAECGGGCSCATCHCYIENADAFALTAPDSAEEYMLKMVCEREQHSRLSCQITVTDALDGLIVRLPESQ
jgi:2Fe-2S ferredoxin